MNLTQIALAMLDRNDTRYIMAVVSNDSEAHCLAQIEDSVDKEYMMPLRVVVRSHMNDEAVETPCATYGYKYAVAVDGTGEVIDEAYYNMLQILD